MDISTIMSMAEPFLGQITPDVFKKLANVMTLIGDQLEKEDTTFSLEVFKKIIKENPSIREIDLFDMKETMNTLVPPIKVTLKVSKDALEQGKKRSFTTKPNYLNENTLQSEKKSTKLTVQLVKDQMEYTINSELHGDVIVDLLIKE